MKTESLVIDTTSDFQKKQKPKEASKESTIKAILIKSGQHQLSNSYVLPSSDLCLLGEMGTVLVPQPNVLPMVRMGNTDIKCSKCGYILALRVKRPQIQKLVIRCPTCSYMH